MRQATEKDMDRLYEMLESYLSESRVTMTVDELLLSFKMIIPTRDEKDIIQGFIAFDVVGTAEYGKVVIWKILYTDPKVRENFKDILRQSLAFFKSHGYEHVESHCTYKVNNFYQRKLRSTPEQYIHFGNIDTYIGRLDN